MSVTPTVVRAGVRRRNATATSGVGFLHFWGALVTGTGLVTVLWALFLPWLASGSATRDSFQLMGLAEKNTFFHAWWYRLAPAVWPFWGPAVVAVLLLLVLRLRRSAAVSAVLLGALAVVVGVLVLVYGSGRSAGGVQLADLGPSTLLIGGFMACLGAVGLFLPSNTRLDRCPRS